MDTVQTLNLLLKTSRDGEAGFRECAHRLRSSNLRAAMEQRADECARAAEELKAAIARHGGVAEDTTSVPADAYRGWVIASGAPADADDHAILAECECGEDVALRDYRVAVEQPLPDDVRQLVERQLAGVHSHHDQVKALRDPPAAGDTQPSGRDHTPGAPAEASRGIGSRMGQRALAQARLHPQRWLGIAAVAGVAGCVVGWYALARQRPQLLGRWLRAFRFH